MSENNITQYVQKIIQPLYAKIQYLEKQNQQLKKRVSILEANSQAQSPRCSYIKNMLSRENQLQGSRLSKRQDDNRSVSGSKQKNGWKSSTKLPQEVKISKQITQHQKFKTKPPIPRMTSKTPTKGQQDIRRATSPVVDKKIVGGTRNQQKKQSTITPKKPSQIIENVSTSNKSQQNAKVLQDPSGSNVSKSNAIKLGKPTIYIQKQSKVNIVPLSPRMNPLQRSSMTDKQQSSGSDVTKQNSSHKLANSQLSINSDKKTINQVNG